LKKEKVFVSFFAVVVGNKKTLSLLFFLQPPPPPKKKQPPSPVFLTCVAIPTGHVLVWHLRIMMHPIAISGAVANPNSSAPSKAATARSLPVRSCPSTCTVARPLRSLATSVWCVSARPSSQGKPHDLIEVHLAAPVPPSWPETKTWSACPFTTPAATTPTPFSETSLTETRAEGLDDLRS